MNNKITRPALRYLGSKWRIAPWIISHFPKHSCYVEPFGGSMAVMLRKKPIPHQIYNDVNLDVVTYFKVLRERPADLMRLLELTPYSRYEKDAASIHTDDELELARRVFIRSFQSIGAHIARPSGWRYRSHAERPNSPMVNDFNRIDHLYDVADRLKDIHIEYDNAAKIIPRYDSPETLFYIDPPYTHGTRSGKDYYGYEMTDEQHIALAEQLHSLQGMVIISGYESSLYSELYSGWQISTKQAATTKGGIRTEILWISPNAQVPDMQRKLL